MQLGVASRSTDEENFDKMASTYKACMDEDTIKELGVAPLAKIVDEVKSSFPLSSQGPNALSESILLLSKYGVSGFVSVGTSPDDTNPDVVVVSIWPPSRIGLPSKERYDDAPLVKKYQEVVVKVLGQLSDEQEETLSAVVDLEKKLAAASPSTEDRQDITVSGILRCTVFGADFSRNHTTQCLSITPLDWSPRLTCRISYLLWLRLKRWTA